LKRRTKDREEASEVVEKIAPRKDQQVERTVGERYSFLLDESVEKNGTGSTSWSRSSKREEKEKNKPHYCNADEEFLITFQRVSAREPTANGVQATR
jgi:hypothetical protein